MKRDLRMENLRNYGRREYRKKQRIKRNIRKKVFIFVFTLLIIGLGSISYDAIHSNAQTREDEIIYKYYKVISIEDGDTLWSIAEQYINTIQYKNKLEYIEEVKKINHMKDAYIRTGQNLIIPYYSTDYVK